MLERRWGEGRGVANTRVQTEVEDWLRTNWFPKQYGQRFHRERLKLRSGGVFDFDAVSDDGKIVASVSTSAGKTASGKYGVGKMMKIRSDIYFLLLVDAQRKVVVFTERDMLDQFKREVDGGRVPSEIEFAFAEIPVELRQRLEQSREKASKEVTPSPRTT
jgi:hypothetical protein